MASADGATRLPTNSATKVYWSLVLIISVIVAATYSGMEGGEEGFWVLVMGLPGIQLAASVVAALVLALSRRGNRRERLFHLGKITLYSMAGAFVGGLLIFGMC